MSALIPILVVTLVGVLFAALALTPMLIETRDHGEKRRGNLVLVHSSDRPGATPDNLHAA